MKNPKYLLGVVCAAIVLLSSSKKGRREFPSLGMSPSPPKEPLHEGDFAKLRFVQGGRGERMWVHVDQVLQGPLYSGRLDNDPVWISGINAGDRIIFGPDQIFEILFANEEESHV